jgi:hypothetical protein
MCVASVTSVVLQVLQSDVFGGHDGRHMEARMCYLVAAGMH